VVVPGAGTPIGFFPFRALVGRLVAAVLVGVPGVQQRIGDHFPMLV